jgi:deoxyinosine 3'endonuclease (endonuclease V)
MTLQVSCIGVLKHKTEGRETTLVKILIQDDEADRMITHSPTDWGWAVQAEASSKAVFRKGRIQA